MGYFNNIQNKPPHERRIHAAQIAAACTVVIFVGWLAALGVRFATEPQGGTTAQDGSANQTLLDGTQTASVENGVYSGQSGNSLEVASSSPYSQ